MVPAREDTGFWVRLLCLQRRYRVVVISPEIRGLQKIECVVYDVPLFSGLSGL